MYVEYVRFVSLLIGQDRTPWVSRHEDWRYRSMDDGWMDVGCWLLVAGSVAGSRRNRRVVRIVGS